MCIDLLELVVAQAPSEVGRAPSEVLKELSVGWVKSRVFDVVVDSAEEWRRSRVAHGWVILLVDFVLVEERLVWVEVG